MCQKDAFFSPTIPPFLFIENASFHLCKKSVCPKHAVTSIDVKCSKGSALQCIITFISKKKIYNFTKKH